MHAQSAPGDTRTARRDSRAEDENPEESRGSKRARVSTDPASFTTIYHDKPSPNDTAEDLSSDPLDYPRKRATIACEICRSRKSRCDGARPKCKLCTDLNAKCVYREPSLKIDAGDKLILEELHRIKELLQDRLGPAATTTPPQRQTTLVASPVAPSTEDVYGRQHHVNLVVNSQSPAVDGPVTSNASNISTMPKTHSTPALHLLQWPVLQDLASRPCDPQVLMELEMARTSLDLSMLESFDQLRNDLPFFAQAFFAKVNTWYAFVNPNKWHTCLQVADASKLQDGAESCMVLLVGALGAAAQSGSISDIPEGQRAPGMDYFAAAYWLLQKLTLRNDVVSAQCHILAAAYLLYLVRPLEAWNLLCQASVKLQLLLAHPSTIRPEVKELSERVFWNTLLIESDLLAELDLPHTGIVQFEESMGMPKSFPFDATNTSQDGLRGVDDLWYFSAEINLRRLLNRVSHLIYADAYKSTSPAQLINSLEPTANRLDAQLEEWYDILPVAIKFSRTRPLARDQTQTVLRLRYFACRTIIFRPYVQAVLADESLASRPGVMDACGKCLEACIRQIEDVTAHHAGHLPYLWQGVSIRPQRL